jgi:non-ribosomal peptide synthetase component E (peptide arylation enzyme)
MNGKNSSPFYSNSNKNIFVIIQLEISSHSKNEEGKVMHVPLVLTDFLDRAVDLYGDKVAIIDEQRSFTYDELGKRVNQLS